MITIFHFREVETVLRNRPVIRPARDTPKRPAAAASPAGYDFAKAKGQAMPLISAGTTAEPAGQPAAKSTARVSAQM